MQSLILLLAASVSVASASVIPRTSPNLPSSAFPHFHTISIEDAQAGKDLPNGFDNSTNVDSFDMVDLMEAAATTQTAAAAACSASPNVRPEWRSFSTPDRQAFMSAIKCLMSKPPSGNYPPATNRYEDLVRQHQLDMPTVHNNPVFLVWHRYYLWTFEQVLRTECAYKAPFPWWDETLDAGKFGQSDMFTSPDYFGALPPPGPDGNGYCVESGAFAGLTCNIGPGTSNTPHCLSRALDESQTAQCNTNYVNTCNARTTYADMESCSEYGPHAYGHDGIGSVMSDVSASPSDPIFWMHHTFVDHGFRIWQNAAVAARTTAINGNDHNGNPLTMNTVISVGGIRPDVTIGQIMNTMSGVSIGGVPFCYKYSY